MDYHQHRQGRGKLYAQAPSSGDHASIVSSIAPFDTVCSGGSSSTTSSNTRRSLDESEVLRCINEYRREHGAPMLRWSSACAREAQRRASHESGPSAEYGENLARSTDHSWRDPTIACIGSIHRWQKEEAGYDYGKPGLSSNTSHFTANVWRLTTHVGFGVFRAKYKGKSTMWVVAYFSPRGNQASDFAHNVLPRGSVYHGDDNMVRRAVDTVSPSVRHPGKAPANRHAREVPGAYMRVETANADVKALRSANGKFTFQVLPNRNIIVRQAERVVWNSGSRSAGKPPVGAPFRLVLQRNGDLVGYDSAARVFWSSETANCGPPPYTLTMQDDGQCVLFDGRWKARWATDSRPITMK